MTKQYFSIPIQYNISDQLQADDIKIPVEILVMHDKVNLNKSNFEFDVIDSDITKESIKNIPILGYIKKIDGSDTQDFSGHEMEICFKNGEIKIIYLERPIGVIPETNNYEYVEVNGKKYVKVIGYLWKDYINDGYEILQENPQKSVSMEIVVDAYEVRKDGIVDIKAYRYTGITILGDNINPAMQGANMQVIGQFSDNQKFSKEFYERVEKLNFELNSNNNVSLEGGETQEMAKEKEGNQIVNEKLELIAKYNFTLEQLDFSIEELSIEELEIKLKEFSVKSDKPENKPELNFSSTYRQKREALANALEPKIERDADGNIIYEEYMWVEDFDDIYVFVEKSIWTDNNHDCKYGRFTYTFDEDTLTATISGEFEEMVLVWLTIDENQKLQDDRNAFTTMSTEFETLKTKASEYEVTIFTHETKITEFEATITNLTSEKDSLISENTSLKEFKSNVEFENKRVEIESLIEDFEVVLKGNEEFEQIKKDVAIDEKLIGMEYQSLEVKLFALEGKLKHDSKKKDKAKKPITFSRVNIDVDDSNDVDDLGKKEYGDASKYLPKK